MCILKRSARLYGDCMQPDYKANIAYQCLLIWLKISYKKKTTFYVPVPLRFWWCFWTRLGILGSPIRFLSRKSKYWRKYKGEKFCWALIWNTILEYLRSKFSTEVRKCTLEYGCVHTGPGCTAGGYELARTAVPTKFSIRGCGLACTNESVPGWL